MEKSDWAKLAHGPGQNRTIEEKGRRRRGIAGRDGEQREQIALRRPLRWDAAVRGGRYCTWRRKHSTILLVLGSWLLALGSWHRIGMSTVSRVTAGPSVPRDRSLDSGARTAQTGHDQKQKRSRASPQTVLAGFLCGT
ncbi:hypothetical protein CHU98_g8933 [Xylaria longipes]|nr:hypothetical protein CHU98_g8933 [Xylaria longipes]